MNFKLAQIFRAVNNSEKLCFSRYLMVSLKVDFMYYLFNNKTLNLEKKKKKFLK